MAQDLRQVGTAELAGSTRPVGEVGQPDPGTLVAGMVVGGHYLSSPFPAERLMAELVTLATACLLGFLHALEVDHMLAVTAFVSRRPTLLTAARFGLRWGLGHSVAVLAAGGLIVATGIHWSPRWDSVAEAAVGVMLIGIGLWSLRATRNLHVHLPAEHGDHAHLHVHGHGTETHGHPHRPAPVRKHAHGITVVGLLHGMAGTTGAVALLPVTLMERPSLAVAYLVMFGFGVTASMTLYAAVTALAMQRASAGSVYLGRRITRVVGWAGVVVGSWWIWRGVGS